MSSSSSSTHSEGEERPPLFPEYSPPTSPPAGHHSPPSSPTADGCNFSPPTSPLREHANVAPSLLDTTPEGSQDSSTSSQSPPHKRNKRNDSDSHPVSRSTLERFLREVATNDLTDTTRNTSRASECETALNSTEVNTGDNHSPSSNEDSEASEVESSSNDDGERSNFSSSSDAAASDSDSTRERQAGSITSEDGAKLLYPGSHLTVDEGILKVLKLYIKERWTKNSLQNCIRLIRELLPKHNDLPPTSVTLLKRLAEVAPFGSEIEHYYCSDCQEPLVNNNDICRLCNSNDVGVFLEYPLDKQIIHFFEHRALASLIDRHKNRVQQEGVISDVQDGEECIKIKAELHGEYDLILMLNVDGVSLSKSSKQEVWTILCTICDIPASFRSSYMILTGVYVGKKKPKMNTFLRPFVSALRNSYQSGVNWKHPDSNEAMSSKIVCPILCADAPAKAIALNVKPFSHRYGCNVCEQKSTRVKLSQEDEALNEILPGRKKKRRFRRMIFKEEFTLRTGERMLHQAATAEETHSPTKGVIGRTVLCELPLFDPASCVCAEYLHVVCLGVVKYFLNLIFFVRGPWYLGDKVDDFDAFLLAIQVPDFIKRLPRGISDFKFMIGSELRAFLLFYSLPAFEGIMSEEYYEHWVLLVGGIFILLQDFIHENDLASAEIMLRLFVQDIKELYGDKYYTYNVHNLLHLCLLVRRWGNLWSTSAFDSEKFNGFIVSHVHGTKHIGKELLNNLKIIQSVHVFERSIQGSVLARPVPVAVELCGESISIRVLSNNEHEALLSAQIPIFKLYSRARLHSHVFTSRVYDAGKKRSNSYVQLLSQNFAEDGLYRYGQILYFVEDSSTRNVFCLLEMFNVIHSKIIVHHATRTPIKHLIPVAFVNKLCVVPVSFMVTKLVKAGDYVCLRPNSLEVNL